MDRKNYIITHIDEAIDEGWLTLYFQPVIRTLSGRICSGEALSRWNDPELGLISPAEFVPALEESGQSWKLAKQVIHAAAGYLSEADRMGMYPIPISINLSRKDFEEMDPFSEVESAVGQYQISRNLLCIEITESTVMDNPEKIKNYVTRFHEAGYEVWMDDFGSAYSSLNMLKDFDFDEIKLDMAFMRHFNDKAKIIVSNCINMAKELGVHTLCEGVETKEQVEFLREHGCEKIQGFYYSRPRPLQELKELIDEGVFSYETAALRSLYDKAGTMKIHAGTANAVVYCREGKVYPLEVSPRLQAGMESAGMRPIVLHQALDMSEADFWQRVNTAIRNSQETGATEEVSYFLNGQYYLLGAMTAASSKAGAICMLEMHNITQSARGLVLANADSVSQSIIGIYDCVYKADLEKKELEVVISDFAGEAAGRKFAYNPEYMQTMIYWKDRARFLQWIDPDRMRRALRDRSRKSFSNLFRMVMPDGQYVWEVFTMLRGAVSDSSEAVLCMKRSLYAEEGMTGQFAHVFLEDTSEESKGEIRGENGTPAQEKPQMQWSSASLWNSLLEQEDLRIFWEDDKRRLRGVSRGFLNYFGLPSSADILGRTEEECGWYVEDQTSRSREDEVLQYGKAQAYSPERVIVNGEARQILVSRYPLYENGEIAGLVGFFVDSAAVHSGREGSERPERTDAETGAMTFQAWGSVVSSYENEYNRREEDYTIAVAAIHNYWKTYHEFGRATAEHMARIATETLRACLPSNCVIGRADKETFTIITRDAAQDLTQRLEEAAADLGKTHYIGAYSGMIQLCWAVSSRSETNNPIRTLGLALERAEKQQSIRSFRNERSAHGLGPAEELPADAVLTREQMDERIQTLLHTFDFVRLADPEQQKVIRYDRNGTRKYQDGNCFDIWGTGLPCDNCISIRTLQTRERLTKFETDGENIYFVMSQYVEVDGKPCVLETVARMHDDSSLGSDERGIFIRALANCRARLYEDSLTGLHNRVYYDELLSDHRSDAVALIDIADLKDINIRYGHLAGDALIRAVARAISSHVHYNDLARYDGDRFVASFRGLSADALETRLRDILRDIRGIHLDRYPEWKISASAGGTVGTGRVSALLPAAEEALEKAEKSESGVMVLTGEAAAQ